MSDFFRSLRLNLNPELYMLGVKNAGEGLMDENFLNRLILVDPLLALDFLGQSSTPYGSSRQDPVPSPEKAKTEEERIKFEKNRKTTLSNVSGFKFLYGTGGNDHLGLLEKFSKLLPELIIVGTFKSIDGDGWVVGKPAQMLGFHTAVGVYQREIWAVAQNAFTHNQWHVVETFGRGCGKLAYESGRRFPANFVELSREEQRKIIEFRELVMIIAPEKATSLRSIAEHAKKIKKEYGGVVVVVAEGFMPPELKAEMLRLGSDQELRERWFRHDLPVEGISGLIHTTRGGAFSDLSKILEDPELAAQFAKTAWQAKFDPHGNVTKLAGISNFIIKALEVLGGSSKVNRVILNYEARGATPDAYDILMGEKLGVVAAKIINDNITGGKAVIYFEGMNPKEEEPMVVDLVGVSDKNNLNNADLYPEYELIRNGVYWESSSSPVVDKDWLNNNARELLDKTIITLSMEGNIPEFEGYDAQNANTKGGLGAYFGDKLEGLFEIGMTAYGIMPAYSKIRKDGQAINIDYQELIDKGILQRVYTDDGKPLVLGVYAWDEEDYSNAYKNPLRKVQVFMVNRGGTPLFLLYSPKVLDFLYVGDRARRFAQEVVFGKAAYELMKELKIIPDILHLNEAHTVVAAAQARADSLFNKTAIIYTNHTIVPAGLEMFHAAGLHTDDNRMMYSIGIPEHKHLQFRSIFLRPGGVVDFCYAATHLADVINAVSDEHAIATKKLYKTMYGENFDIQVIGVLNGSGKTWKNDLLIKLEKEGKEASIEDLRAIHQNGKKDALEEVEKRAGIRLNPDKFTVWLVRRIVEYKSIYSVLRFLVHIMCADRGREFTKDGLRNKWFRDIPNLQVDYNRELAENVLNYIFQGREVVKGLGMQIVVGGPIVDSFAVYWVSEFQRWTNEVEELKGRFVYVPTSDIRLLKMQAIGADNCSEIPWPLGEACGTSGQRTALNGGVALGIRGAGPVELIDDYNEETGVGNGFLIGSYTYFSNKGLEADKHKFFVEAPGDILKKMEIMSRLYYDDTDKWKKLMFDSYRNANKKVTAKAMEERYALRVYIEAIKKREEKIKAESSSPVGAVTNNPGKFILSVKKTVSSSSSPIELNEDQIKRFKYWLKDTAKLSGNIVFEEWLINQLSLVLGRKVFARDLPSFVEEFNSLQNEIKLTKKSEGGAKTWRVRVVSDLSSASSAVEKDTSIKLLKLMRRWYKFKLGILEHRYYRLSRSIVGANKILRNTGLIYPTLLLEIKDGLGDIMRESELKRSNIVYKSEAIRSKIGILNAEIGKAEKGRGFNLITSSPIVITLPKLREDIQSIQRLIDFINNKSIKMPSEERSSSLSILSEALRLAIKLEKILSCSSSPLGSLVNTLGRASSSPVQNMLILDLASNQFIARPSVTGRRTLYKEGITDEYIAKGLAEGSLKAITQQEFISSIDRSTTGIGISGGGDCAGISDFFRSLRLNLNPELYMLGVRNAGEGLMDEKFLNRLILVDPLLALDFLGQSSTPYGSSRQDPVPSLEKAKTEEDRIKFEKIRKTTLSNVSGFKFLYGTGGNDHLGLLEKFSKLLPELIIVGTFKSIDGDGWVVGRPAQMLGFHTAVGVYQREIWAVAQNAYTHNQWHVVETFGRACGKLAYESGRRFPANFDELSREEQRKITEFRDLVMIIAPEKATSLRSIAEHAKKIKKEHGGVVVVVAEGFMPPELKAEMLRLGSDQELRERWFRHDLPVEGISG
ncbi:MAG: 6-phosphofructokinase, partial [Candidatus Omnitrophota bacterium]